MPTATLLPERADTVPVGVVRTRPVALMSWRPDSVLTSWGWTLLVAVLAGVTRFWALGFPGEKIFDEVYYATEAQEMLRYGYEDNRAYMFIVHPPLGKWLIAGSSSIFGDNSFGWRAAPALAGVLSVVIVTRVAMRMFRSVLLGVLAGVLLSLDGISLVMSRVSLLDIFLQLFVLAGFAALLLDRDMVRRRLGDLYEAGVDLTHGVPSLGPRPWRLVAGVMFGLAFGVKWSALSFWVGFALLSLLWDRGAFKSVGVEFPSIAVLKRSLPGAFGSLGIIASASYLATWTGWFVGENSWNRHWGDTHPGSGLFGLLPSGIRSLLDYHHLAYEFHTHLYDPHAYKANPWSWLVLGRPILFYYPKDVTGCGAVKADGTPDCVRSILLIGTPIMYWAILPVLGWLLWHWITTRDWRAGVVLLSFVVGWGVWLQNTRRTGFLFYMTPLMPFLVLGLTMAVGAMLSPSAEDRTSLLNRRFVGPGRPPADDDPEIEDERDGVRSVGLREWLAIKGMPATRVLRTGVVVLWLGGVVADFIWMWPILTGGMLTYQQWHMRMWFPGWI
ncbi:MAG: dolichyl-phosphate-mannose-protein mannosyltransferase [Pseudonocardiales bacterium]|nr:dolichyl-phosphate-mannose-protein mannosyltransferase [Pseudonocardiales bacterium]